MKTKDSKINKNCNHSNYHTDTDGYCPLAEKFRPNDSKMKEQPEDWEKNYVKTHIFINDWLRGTYGLDDDSILNAGEVEELLRLFSFDLLQSQRAEIIGEIKNRFDKELKRQTAKATETGDEERAKLSGYANGVAHRVLESLESKV